MQRASFQQGSVLRKSRSRGPDVWVFRHMDGEIQRFEILGTVKKFTSKAAARKEASQRLKEINERLAGITVAGLCDRFKHECEKDNSELRPHSIATYKSFLRRGRDKWGDQRVEDVAGDILALEEWVSGSIPSVP